MRLRFKEIILVLLFSLLHLIQCASYVGQCQRSDGRCSEASKCKYIWTDTIDCTVKQLVCCYNDHDYIDLG
ncbi:unnamed protein product [Chironomus riparius]|uniref:Uncharacterized protein n=1 Tax=Chironomus riparius TaxID=315576 RepID=A0A9N9RJX0_9DIPT|nr:unnamed protein product [Chironomus riparius]